jgi:hypothetical protein
MNGASSSNDDAERDDPTMTYVAPDALSSNGQPALDGWFSGAEQLISDSSVVLLLLRDGRNRACARLFGVSERDAGLITIIALSVVAQAASLRARAVLRALHLYGSDAVIGEGMLNEGFYRLAGDGSRDVSFIGSLILGAVLLNRLRPVLQLSLHDLRVAAQDLRLDFDHRYGHLIRPNRPRRQPSGAEVA